MSYFLQNGDAFFPTPGKESVLETLPVGNYVVAKSMQGMFFQKAPVFTKPGKMYGTIEHKADRILSTFLDRERATGALFAGEKGSGKSQLARLISLKGYEMGIPTILVNAPWEGDEFSSLLASVEQPAIIQMDEFEKVYKPEQQESILTLLDGTMTTKKLFILTVNNKYRVNDHMRNRPGRLFYALDFAGLESAFVREYCTDTLHDQEHVEVIVRISTIFQAFNFDMLKALVEEMNRYKQDPFEAMEMLNAKPVNDDPTTKFEVQVWNPAGEEVKVAGADEHNEQPMAARGGAVAVYGLTDPDDEDEDPDGICLIVRANEVQKLNAERGVFEFLTDGHKVVFTKKESTPIGLRQLAY